MAYPWVKLWTEFVNDPKIVLLPEHLQLVYVKLLCICGEYDQERKGWLPAPKRLAVTLRSTPEQVLADLRALAETDPDDPDDAPLVVLCDGRWMIAKFEVRQGAMSATERSTAMRDKQHKGAYYAGADATPVAQTCNESATNRCTDLDVDVDVDQIRLEVDVDAPATTTADPITAQFYRGLDSMGVNIVSQAQGDAFNAIVDDIRSVADPPAFIEQLMTEAAATTSGRITPRWFEAVVDRCIREGRMPGDKRANGNGRDRPGATVSDPDAEARKWADVARQWPVTGATQ